MMTFNFTVIVYTYREIDITCFLPGSRMPIIFEAILVSAAMLLVFATAFLAVFLLAITLFPVERSLSKIIWEATAPKKLRPPPKVSFRDFSKKH